MRNLKLHHWIAIGMGLGVALGLPLRILADRGAIDAETASMAAGIGKGMGTLFLRLLKMVVVPLIVCSLVSGVTSLGDLRKLGRLGGKTFAFYMASSLLAIVTGITLVNVLRPGVGASVVVDGAPASALPEVAQEGHGLGTIVWEQLLRMIPPNPISAAAEGDMLPIIFFSILFGIFLSLTDSRQARLLEDGFNGAFEVMMRLTMFVIHLAPLGVFGFMLFAVADKGLDVFASLGMYMLTVFLGLCFHGLVTLPLLLLTLGRRSPLAFAQAMAPALITAFSTASSNATLPLTMSTIETRAGVQKSTSAFVLPLGATINMDGTALYEAVAVLFIAQAYGMDLSLGQQAVVAFTALLASIGAAGIPHAGTVMMVIVLDAVGLPSSAVGLILAVDRVLDMCRTTINVWSDATAAAIVDRLR